MEPAHLPNNMTFCSANPENLVYFMQRINSYSISTARQTDYMHRQDFFLYGNLHLSLHYVPSFTLFVKEN